jgi:CRISPR-associated protein Cas1
MRELARAGVLVGFCGGGGKPLFSANEVDIEVAWLSPQSEYRPTEYLQAWVRFVFEDALRLKAAKAFQCARLERIAAYWPSSRELRDAGFSVRSDELTALLKTATEGVEAAIDTETLLTGEARLTKALFRLAAHATG